MAASTLVGDQGASQIGERLGALGVGEWAALLDTASGRSRPRYLANIADGRPRQQRQQ
jgi:hypothetical protein